MPFRSRGPLLAGMATLLGACATGAGCQTSGVPHHDTYVTRCGCTPPAPAEAVVTTTAVPAAVPPAAPAPARRPLLAFLRRPLRFQQRHPFMTTAEPPAAVMLRPVPAGTVMPDGSVMASSWQPAQHLADDADVPTPGVTPAGGPAVGVAPGGVIPTAGRGPAEVPTLPLASSGPDLPHEGDAGVVGEGVPLHDQGTVPQMQIAGPPPTRPAAPAQLPPPAQPAVAGPAPHAPAPPGGGPDTPRECAKRALSPYIIEPPDILLIQATRAVTLEEQPIAGTHLVRPDGTISLGVYGSVYVAGLTLEQAKDAIVALLQRRLRKLSPEKIREGLEVDVAAFNSKFYYVITDGAGYGEQAFRIPITGNETVLDAIAQVGGLPPVASKKRVWVARANCHSHGGAPEILPVDWCGVAQRGESETNYQIFPGDRVYVHSDGWLRTDTWLSKRISPIERVLGVTLLGATTVNAIKGQTPGTVR